MRAVIGLGGDTDTNACLTGMLAQAYHGVPRAIGEQALDRLPPDLLKVYHAFVDRYPKAGEMV